MFHEYLMTTLQDKYRQHRDIYVQSILGKPMEKLSVSCQQRHLLNV